VFASQPLNLGRDNDVGLAWYNVPIVIALVFLLFVIVRRFRAGRRCLLEGGIKYGA
jgi:hypothetical protein